MSGKDLARRTVIAVHLDGVDISEDINNYLLSMTYTDNEGDKTDDLQISLDDREGIWLEDWLSGRSDSDTGTRGLIISAVIIQKNFNSDGTDDVLDCGEFEIDGLDASGPPGAAAIKATSLPYSSSVRMETKTKAWENINLSAIAEEMATDNGMMCMYESSFDPLYDRREQMQISDIVFLQGLCYDAGISLKVTGNIIVLFDAAEYEEKPAVREIKRGESDVISYRFGASTHGTYSKCNVRYTDPQTGQTIEYTYTPKHADPDAPVLNINERVRTRDEARNLAMRRLRQKNKEEYSAEFTLAGDVSLVAGVNVDVAGWGMFDGKYIIQSTTHSVTASGYTLQIKLRRVLEDY